MELDLDIVARTARRAETRTRWGRALGVVELAAGFATALREELDFRVEAANMATVVASTSPQGNGLVRIPAVHHEMCTRRVLSWSIWTECP